MHFLNNVIRHHGCPDRIIADNDVRLRAGFWDALTKRLGIEMNHTSAYHPRANGKVENSHSTLYDILRSMVSRWGKNWAEHLPMAEFAFNSSVSASTGFSPFQVAHGHSPPFPGELRGERSSVPRAEAAATRTIALTTACRDAFEDSQMDNQEAVSRREDVPVKVGDLVLLSTTHLVSLKDRTANSRLSSRFVGPFKVVAPPGPTQVNHGPSKNYVWLAVPLTLSGIHQPINLARLRRFVERPSHLGAPPPTTPIPAIATNWARCGKHIDRVSARDLAEFCIGHELEFLLPADYYPEDHHIFPYKGARRVRAYDTYSDSQTPLELSVYLLDKPLPLKPDNHDFETGMLPVVKPRHLRAGKNVTLIRALKFTFPNLIHLKDLLPNADHSVVYKNTLVPLYSVVADRLNGGGKRELLVQFTKTDYENSAWIAEKFVPQSYVDEFWGRVEPDGAAAPPHA